jgi:hypothetical protein
VRRSINGRRILCSCWIMWIFFFYSYSLLTSPLFSLLELNQRSNSSLESKMSGRMKLSRLHSSCRLFCNGVPVNNSLKFVDRLRTTWESRLYSFLILCASSIMRYFHRIFFRYFRQIRTPSKLVHTTSKLPLRKLA